MTRNIMMTRSIMMTKKNWLRVLCGGLAVVLAGFMLGGCATSRIYDKSVPMKEQCVIVNAQVITTIDGENIGDPTHSLALLYPAGKHTVRVRRSLRYTIASQTYTDSVHSIYIPYTLESYATFEFEPYKKYVIENIYPSLSYNGKTLETQDEGVTVTTSRDGKVSVVNPGLVIRETGTRPSSTYVGAEFRPSRSIGWSYKDQIGGSLGSRAGLSILHGYLDIKLLGEAGIGGGIAFPDMSDYGAGFSVYYGGVADITVSKIGLEFGGGMIHGFHMPMSTIGEGIPTHGFSTPYLQAGILFPGKRWSGGFGLYGQYYLNGEQWYNTFGAGIKLDW
jgi:hypothetical protein